MGALRFRLRDATASDHEAVEAVMALADACQHRDTYRALLERMWGLYGPLEAALGEVAWTRTGLDFEPRRKLSWIETDLIALGLDAAAVAALPRARRLPPIEDEVEAMGVLYVLEGASLGGQLISRRLAAELGVGPESGGRFFASYGEAVGARWRDYLSALEIFAESPGDSARIEDAAKAAFAGFLAWFGDRAAALAPGGSVADGA